MDKPKVTDILEIILPILFKKLRSRKGKETEKLFQVKGDYQYRETKRNE